MKAVDANLLELLKKAERFIVPIYQRVYSWDREECLKLWEDIARAGSRADLAIHFTGSIVYIERGESNLASREPHLIIDGQQRVTTVTLILAALAARLEELPEAEQEPVQGFSPKKIRNRYLVNDDEDGDDYYKLTLTKIDREALRAVIRNAPRPEQASRVSDHFTYFLSLLRRSETDLVAICRGLSKLVVVDVKLTRGQDDPQLVFESMNATGKRLSQADLIRNFVLMDLPQREQTALYAQYWHPMEQRFVSGNEKRFDEFVRNYLTLKRATSQYIRVDEVYEEFKTFAFEQESRGTSRADLVIELSRYARFYAHMAFGREPDRQLRSRFAETEQLATVTYPFLLRVYSDYDLEIVSHDEFLDILATLVSYLFRRAICKIPTNSLTKTFSTLAGSIDTARYAESIQARLLTMPDYRRFPTDDEFRLALVSVDVYGLKRRKYFLDSLENRGRKERAVTDDYTIEHIMPQTLDDAWKASLGDDWEAVHERYLHTLGNLTLTGYNSEYSNRSFVEKRDMVDGFAKSPLRLNDGLGQLETWGEDNIRDRAHRLADRALEVWSRPVIGDERLMAYRDRFADSRGFDWSQAHTMLNLIPEGRWTSYESLAVAVGTSAQAMAAHLSSCGSCSCAYRVLTSRGTVAENFRWSDSDEMRTPIEVLAGEGVEFDADRIASATQKLSSEDLLELAGELG